MPKIEVATIYVLPIWSVCCHLPFSTSINIRLDMSVLTCFLATLPDLDFFLSIPNPPRILDLFGQHQFFSRSLSLALALFLSLPRWVMFVILVVLDRTFCASCKLLLYLFKTMMNTMIMMIKCFNHLNQMQCSAVLIAI